MSHFQVDERDLFFILNDQLDYGRLCNLPRYEGLDRETLDLTVTQAVRFARGVVAPLQAEGEAWGTRFTAGSVTCSPAYREALRLYGENGWIGLAREVEWGGSGLPHMLRFVVNDLMYGACQSFNMCPSLTHGAAHLIESFGTEELKARFVPPMYAGRWTGTMCLTESNAGSNLAALKTVATPDGDGYLIKGTKIFISWAEHDLAENIIHLVLARTPGAPEGVRGISLFAVPKFKVDKSGAIGEPNDVECTGVEKKLGLHGSPTATLTFGSEGACRGYLVGREHQGLAQMFQMMNAARINSGVSAMSMAGSAYRNALEYAKTRVQGSDLAGRKKGYVPIIDHPDVRRMLLEMKATVDGLRSMIYSAAYWHDLAEELPEGEEKLHYAALQEFLTPIVKAYSSDMGFRVCVTAVQCLGGYGFCTDYPLEQYLRDSKVTSLYEGTNGIQALDLMGRKMESNEGAPFKAYLKELGNFCSEYSDDAYFGPYVAQLAQVVQELSATVRLLNERRAGNPLHWGVSTASMLTCFGEVTVAWRLLDMGLKAAALMSFRGASDFYSGKVAQATWLARSTLPLTRARLETCRDEVGEAVSLCDGAF